MEPQYRLGIANLTRLAFEGVDLTPLRNQLLSQCLESAGQEAAYMDLSVIDQLHGNVDLGLDWQSKALAQLRVYRTYHPHDTQRKLLVFAQSGPMGANTPVEFLLQYSDFEIVTHFPNLNAEDLAPLPDHDIAFCAAPVDSDRAQAFYETVKALTGRADTKTINLPEGSITFERDALGQSFPTTDGLRFPNTIRVMPGIDRALKPSVLGAILENLGGYPYVIRPVGTHAGVGLAKLNSEEELNAYLKERTEQAFFISEFINYATLSDGAFRKYRLVFIDGKVFPCHMAISNQWDVWYSNSDMQDSDEKRREEAVFMDRFTQDFAKRHHTAFDALAQGIDLEYFGIDCAEDQDGNLVVFEADNALIVHDMDSNDIFPYKQKHMRRVFGAFESMLVAKCPALKDDDYDTKDEDWRVARRKA